MGTGAAQGVTEVAYKKGCKHQDKRISEAMFQGHCCTSSRQGSLRDQRTLGQSRSLPALNVRRQQVL